MKGSNERNQKNILDENKIVKLSYKSILENLLKIDVLNRL